MLDTDVGAGEVLPEDPERRRRLKWRVLYPAATVLPLYAIAFVSPPAGAVLLFLVLVPTGLFMGAFGEDMRSEEARINSSWASSHDGGLGPDPEEYAPGSPSRHEHLVAYATVVAVACLVGFVAVMRAMFG